MHSMSSPSSTGTPTSMPGMDMGSPHHQHSGSLMSMADMMMVFFTSTTTPLYATGWTPRTDGQYAATCLFLVVLPVLFRGLIAVRSHFPEVLEWLATRRRGGGGGGGRIVLPSESVAAAVAAEEDPDGAWKLSGTTPPRHWFQSVEEAVLRAFLDTMLAVVSYLLMLAVMTMNIGYFLSVLGGTFLGSLFLGGWTPAAAH